MPSIPFILPHWLYWSGLILFPLIAQYLVARQKRLGPPSGPSLFIAYLFWLCSGFLGIHRLYLKNRWWFIFLPVFAVILYYNGLVSDAREDVSRTRAGIESTERATRRAAPESGTPAAPDASARLQAAQAAEAKARQDFAAAETELGQRRTVSRDFALLLAFMLLVDAALLPGLVRRRQAYETLHPAPAPIDIPEPAAAGTREDPTIGMHTPVVDAIEWLNIRAGTYVAYWAVISVFVYYFEVVSRYVFNSPTIWVHESMYLMYGMQYMICGAFAYREDQHVRVDVVYTRFSPRGKAIADIVTSVFFFIFIGTLLWTGTRFALDAIQVGETSFAEWGIQYWPVKLMIPIGAALMLLQGIAKLLKDIAFVMRREA